MAQTTVGVITTAMRAEGDPLRPFAAPAHPAPMLFTDHLFWAKDETTTDDPGSILPNDALAAAAEAGRIGSLSPRYYGVPTLYSTRRTRRDAATVEEWCRDDGVGLVLLVAL